MLSVLISFFSSEQYDFALFLLYHFLSGLGRFIQWFPKKAIENPSSQAYAHVFSANFAADCVKNPCRATARLRIFALSATKLCSKIRTHFL